MSVLAPSRAIPERECQLAKCRAGRRQISVLVSSRLIDEWKCQLANMPGWQGANFRVAVVAFDRRMEMSTRKYAGLGGGKYPFWRRRV
jgi:hypothetical protein